MESLSITEKQFEAQVKDLAKIFGWMYYHTWKSVFSPKGFPDCVLVRQPRLIFAELKSEKGKVSSEQRAWLDALGKLVNVEVYLWRPDDIETITKVLR